MLLHVQLRRSQFRCEAVSVVLKLARNGFMIPRSRTKMSDLTITICQLLLQFTYPAAQDSIVSSRCLELIHQPLTFSVKGSKPVSRWIRCHGFRG